MRENTEREEWNQRIKDLKSDAACAVYLVVNHHHGRRHAACRDGRRGRRRHDIELEAESGGRERKHFYNRIMDRSDEISVRSMQSCGRRGAASSRFVAPREQRCSQRTSWTIRLRLRTNQDSASKSCNSQRTGFRPAGILPPTIAALAQPIHRHLIQYDDARQDPLRGPPPTRRQTRRRRLRFTAAAGRGDLHDGERSTCA